MTKMTTPEWRRIANAGAKIGNSPSNEWPVFGGWSPAQFVDRSTFGENYREACSKQADGDIFTLWISRAGGFMYLYTEGLSGITHPEVFTAMPCARDLPVWAGNNLVCHPNGELWSNAWTEDLRVSLDEFQRLAAGVHYDYRTLHIQRCLGYWYFQDYRRDHPEDLWGHLCPIAFTEAPKDVDV